MGVLGDNPDAFPALAPSANILGPGINVGRVEDTNVAVVLAHTQHLCPEAVVHDVLGIGLVFEAITFAIEGFKVQADDGVQVEVVFHLLYQFSAIHIGLCLLRRFLSDAKVCPA